MKAFLLPVFLFCIFLSGVYSNAQTVDCSSCAGNPVCMMFCTASTQSGQTVPGSTSPTTGIDLGGLTGGITNGANSIAGPLGEANTHLSNLNTQITNVNTNAANGITTANNYLPEVQKFNQNYADTNKIAADGLAIVDKRSGEALELGKSTRDMVDKNWSETNSILKEMNDPKHVFLLAGAASAGAIIGGALAKLAVTGLSEGIKFLSRWISGEIRKEKEDRIAAEFEQASKVYKEAKESKAQLLKSIDLTLSMYEATRKSSFDENQIATSIEVYIQKKKSEVLVRERGLNDITSVLVQNEFDPSCQTETFNQNSSIEKIVAAKAMLKTLESIQKLNTKKPIKEQICGDLIETFRKLATIESTLQLARPALLKGEVVWNKKFREQNKVAEKSLNEVRKKKFQKDVSKEQSKLLRYYQNLSASDVKRMKREVSNSCVKLIKAVYGGWTLSKEDKNEFCLTQLYSKEFQNNPRELLLTFFPGIEDSMIEKIIGEQKIVDTVRKIQTFESYKQGEFASWEDAIADHEKTQVGSKKMLTLDPMIVSEKVKSMNDFIETLQTEQNYLYEGDLRARKTKIEAICGKIE